MKFVPVEVTPEQFIEALRRYRGIRHSMRSSHIKEDFEHHEIAPTGFLRCAGLLFAGFRWVGWLPREFDLDITRAQSFAVLHANFTKVPESEMRVGDLVFLDINGPQALEHVAVCSEINRSERRIIHCLNDDRGVGRVFECAIEDPIDGVYRPNAFVGMGGDSVG